MNYNKHHKKRETPFSGEKTGERRKKFRVNKEKSDFLKKRPEKKESPSPVIRHEKKESVRINKYLSEQGFCSRREADKFVEQGRVLINGKTAVMGDKVFPGQNVTVDGKILQNQNERVYLLFYKPVGLICTTDNRSADNIIDYIGYKKRIFPIGRLDVASQGLILLTNDGDIVNKILRSVNNHEKEYLVTVDKPLTSTFIEGMAGGVPILNRLTKTCAVYQEGPKQFRIILTEGLNRQIRRMTEYFGYNVVKLERIRIMHLTKEGLTPGKWRYLTGEELRKLNQIIKDSKK